MGHWPKALCKYKSFTSGVEYDLISVIIDSQAWSFVNEDGQSSVDVLPG